MKFLLPLLLLLSLRLSAQDKTLVLDTFGLRSGPTGYTIYFKEGSGRVGMRDDGAIIIQGMDSLSAIKLLWKRMQEVNIEKSDYITLFVRGYEIITGLPDYLKDTTKHVWWEYFTELKRMGYKLPIRKQ